MLLNLAPGVHSQRRDTIESAKGWLMGSMYYGAARTRIDLDDRLLAHLQVVVAAKLRRQEGFLLYWTQKVENGSGRNSIWLHPAIELHFRFDGNRPPTLDRELLDRLSNSAQSQSGLDLDHDLDWTGSRR